MRRVFLGISAFLAGISVTIARPQQTAGVVEKSVPSSYSTGPDIHEAQDKHRDSINLLDTMKWKDMLADGKVQQMVDTIQRALGARRAFRARTQWGGPEHPKLGNSVRNTVNWNAYKSDKKKLDIIMDSKFNKHNGKVNVVEPSLGLSFQMKY